MEVFTQLVTTDDEDGKYLPELVGALLQMIRSQELYKPQRKQPRSEEAPAKAGDKAKADKAKAKQTGKGEVSSSVSRAAVVFHLLAEVSR